MVMPPLASSKGRTKGTIRFAVAPRELVADETAEKSADEIATGAEDALELVGAGMELAAVEVPLPAGLSPPPPLPQPANSIKDRGRTRYFIVGDAPVTGCYIYD